ncbi:MAG: hypothetical protein H6741_06120 [Alphaproteobacteria bacterium]|nr:hypothetical protein [Alphaproteobacteria bacterium]MCB9792285.1 hypothetical protein [Alphaproteobacteria bacterium]
MNTHIRTLATLALAAWLPSARAGDVDAEHRDEEARAAKARAPQEQAPTPTAYRPPPMHGAAVGPLTLHLEDERYVSFGARATLWSLPEGQPLAVSSTVAEGDAWDQTRWVPAPRWGVAYAPEGHELVEVDLESLAVLRRWPMALPGSVVTQVDVSPNGRFLLAVVPGAELRVWERESGALVASLQLSGRPERMGPAWVLDDGRGQPLVPWLEDDHPRLWTPGAEPALQAWDDFTYRPPIDSRPLFPEEAYDGIFLEASDLGFPSTCAYWMPTEGPPREKRTTSCFWRVLQAERPLQLLYDEPSGSALVEHLREVDDWRGEVLWALYYDRTPVMSLDPEGLILVYMTRPNHVVYVKDLLYERGQGRRLWGRYDQLIALERGTLLLTRGGRLRWIPRGAKRPVSIEGEALPTELQWVGSTPADGRFALLVGEGGGQSYLVDLEALELRPLP